MINLFLRLLFAILLIISLMLIISCDQTPGSEEQIENTLELLNLPANRWIKFHQINNGSWWKKGHAGLAYDSKRGSLLIFGSDTHGEDWDNTIHEFLPQQRRWIHHGSDAPQKSYRVNAAGNPISGIKQIQPWAMHTYDGVVYDPNTDSILVIAEPQHNPIGRTISQSKTNPIWRYKLETKEWQAIKVDSKQKVNFFGAASAFDSARNTSMICSHGLWSLPSDDHNVRKVFKSPQCLHRTMAYDSWYDDLYLFGAYKASNQVWKLQRDILTDNPIKWIKITPTGDNCPPFTTTPVAFDQQTGVFLLVVDNPDKGSDGASTFAYHPTKNQYFKLTNGSLPKVGMNFMMAWDHIHKVFFLVTGNWKNGVTVWAMRLDLS